MKYLERQTEFLLYLNDDMIEATPQMKVIAEIFDIEFRDSESEHGWFLANAETTTKEADNSEQKALHIADVVGRLSINDLEDFHYSLRIPKITEKFFTEEMCGKLNNKLDEKLTGIDYVNIEENGILVIGFRNMIITKKQEDEVVSVLNDL